MEYGSKRPTVQHKYITWNLAGFDWNKKEINFSDFQIRHRNVPLIKCI